MATYRLYLRALSGAIQGRQDLEAENDRTAIVMAQLIYDACSDVCNSFEVWHGTREISSSAHDALWPRPSAAELNARRQKALVQHEEAVRDSQWMIARSQRLLREIERLTDRLDGRAAD